MASSRFQRCGSQLSRPRFPILHKSLHTTRPSTDSLGQRSRVGVEIAASLVAVLSAQALRSISFSEDQREKASPYCAGPGLTRVSVWCCYATHAPLQLPTAANHRAGNTEEVPARIRDTITTRSHRRRQDECFRSDTTRGRDLTFTSSRVGAYVRTTVRPF